MLTNKVLAINLPAFHRVKENDEWWGEGFTEWDNVKLGKPFFKGHQQPRIPLEKYYDLSKLEDIKHQIDLANKYGIYGFIYYHYWFGNNKQIFEKPLEILLDHKEIDTHYCFCWANETWRTTWHGKDPNTVLLEQTYGDQIEWEKHYQYLRSFFLDERYIKINNKPVLFIYKPNEIPQYDQMVDYFDVLARKDKFDGVYIVEYISSKNKDLYSNKSSAVVEFEPLYTTYFDISMINKAKRLVCKKLHLVDYQSYDNLWKKIINRHRQYDGKPIFKSCFVDWDNSARKGKNSMIVKNANPIKFENYLEQLIKSNRVNSNDFVVINAFNEWSEGAYLEPDVANQYGYLEAIKKVICGDK